MVVLAKRASLVQAWTECLQADLSASTIKGIVGWVSTMFSAAVDDGIVTPQIRARPRSVRRPKVPARKVEP